MTQSITNINNIDYEENQDDTQRCKYLTFNLGNDSFGIEIRHVTEIVGMQPITSIPDLPVFNKGIINLRGRIIPVMDIRLRFKKEFKDYDDRTCIIVLNGSSPAGVIVDNVSDVLYIPDTEIVEPPNSNQGDYSYIKNVGKVNDKIILLLDCEILLNCSDSEIQ